MIFRPSRSLVAFILGSVAVLPLQARAASAPALPPGLDPGVINEAVRRQYEPERTDRKPPQPSVIVDAQQPVEQATAGAQIRFALKAIRFDPSHYLGPEMLAALAQPLEGREVGIDELKQLVERINALYTQHGLATARAVLAPQSIEDGTVVIRLIEGRLGAIAVKGGSPQSQRHAQRAIGLQAGAFADPRDLENRLRLFNRENDAHLRAGLSAGQTLGQTDLELQLVEPPALGLEVFADNNGYRSTGMWEQGAVLRAYRVLGSADRASLVAVRSDGVRSLSAAWSTPLGQGARFGLTASHGETTIHQNSANPLDIRGRSNSLGADVALSLVNRNAFSLHLDTTLNATQSDTRISGERVVDNDVLTAAIAVMFDVNTPHLVGSSHLEAAYNHVFEHVSGTTFEPLVLRGDAQFNRSLGHHGALLRLRGDGQWTGFDTLPGLLQYQIGGARSARALDPGTAAGDRGYTVAFEAAQVRTLGRHALEVSVFVDHAAAFNAGQPEEGATDVGTGLSISLWNRVNLRGQYAWALDHRGAHGLSKRGYLSISARF
ncbi:ShlB/FhaC/HecB family hemolysin secretion/activation protein [Novosphingobium sp.]|uniref:ShlB/FhaC/HecB family hemolysin secretion/activation protein n=1 Tax=Novosphingobium sp. TaxID=1874826 RepID=UPI0038BA3EEB